MTDGLKCTFASLPQVERGVSKVIGGDPKGKNFLYTNGKSVIIRNIENPSIADIYTEHVQTAVVAKYCDSGNYIASGDVSGKLRIWDTTQKTHLLKNEFTPFSGRINDIAWTSDNNRIAVVGEGREKFAAAIIWDTGSSVGDISGHSKIINSVDIKPSRPFRLITGSDDTTSSLYEGPPFKFKNTKHDHKKFVNCVRFSPDGARYVTAGADGMMFIYDGKTGEFISALGGEKAHNGGIYAISWSHDSSHLISASGDKTVKLWDVGADTAVTTFNMGTDVLDLQLGCLWQNEHLLSISCSGYINYLDKNKPDKPLRIIKGHSKSIQCLTVHKCGGESYIYSGSHDGHINHWDAKTGENDCISGKGHSNQVSRMVVCKDELVSCSMDDTVRFTSINKEKKKEYCAADVVKMDSQPKSVSASEDGMSLAVCVGQLVLIKDKKKVFTLDNLSYEPEVGAMHPEGTTAAVGGNDGKIYLYTVKGNTLQDEGKILEIKGVATEIAYSNDGAHLAVIDDKKIATVFTVADGYSLKDEFYGHHAKPVTLAWSPDNEHFATGGMDMSVYIWNINNSDTRIKLQECHRMHHVSSLAWVDKNTLVTASHDATIKEWEIQY